MALVSVNYINPGVDCLLNKNCIKNTVWSHVQSANTAKADLSQILL